MKGLWRLAGASAWHRRFVLSITLMAIALSAFLLASIEQIRTDVREGFTQSISGTDLIVGPRTGATQLLLYSIFRIGQATNNMRWESVEALMAHRAVRWVVPISLGDSHHGFPVVGTSTATCLPSATATKAHQRCRKCSRKSSMNMPTPTADRKPPTVETRFSISQPISGR